MPNTHNSFSYDPSRSVIWHLSTSRAIDVIQVNNEPAELPEDKTVLVASIDEAKYVFQADKEIPISFIQDAAAWYAAHVKSAGLNF